MERLEELHLDENGLVMLPDEMGGMKRLRALYVRRNQLQILPETLLKDTPIDRMQLEGMFSAHN
jgi:Leucine-rich repeat (LRR) protein